MEYHRALATLPTPLTARVGLHVGPVILRENAADDVARGAKPLEVDGLAKPIAARVMALARGGQTLLSAAAREALGTSVAQAGLARPLAHQGRGRSDRAVRDRRAEAPPSRHPSDGEKAHRVVWTGDWWLPVNEIPNNLPHQATSFIGRERELEEVKSLLGTARLLTLVGMGGLGKTRLSLQIAAEQIARLSRRRLVPRPRADQRPGADRQRGGAGARRARGARSAAAADGVRAPAEPRVPC